MKRSRLLIAALVTAFALIAAACGDSGSTTEAGATTTAAPTTTEAAATTAAPTTTAAAPAAALPGEGINVTMARADWSTGYFQAALYRNLMQQLGYTVSDPSELEIGPSLFYLSLAQGDADFWVNSWMPGHKSWLSPDMPDGTKVGDHVTTLGAEMNAGGLQGYLITKATADEFGITTLDQLNDDPAITALFDTDGNGKANIFGCQESWTCDNIINEQIAFSGWDNVEETIAGYDAMMAEAVAKVEAGEPMVIYTWTPSAYITKLIPGQNVYWLAVNDVIDGSNASGQEGGEDYAQLPGTANIPADQCPAAADAGTCQLGWIAADILVTANNDFLAANPAAEELFKQVQLSVVDVSLANVEQSNGCDTNDCIVGLAQTWIDEHADLVNTWLDAAKAAA